MTRVVQQKPGGIFSREHDRHAEVVFRKTSLCELQFEFGEYLRSAGDLGSTLADATRHLRQDAVNFCLLFVVKTNKVVVLLDRLDRLDKDGLAAGTAAMHNAWNTSL